MERKEISLSKINNVKDCGFRYYLSEVLKLNQGENAVLNMHNAMQDAMHKLYTARKECSDLTTEQFIQNAIKKVDKKFYGTEMEYQFAVDGLTTRLIRYYNWFQLQSMKVLAVNQEYKVPVEDSVLGDYSISVKVDAVIEQDEQIHVIIFKNGKPQLTYKRIPKNLEKAGESNIVRDLQLGFATMGLLEKSNGKEIFAEYHYLKNKNDTFDHFVVNYNDGPNNSGDNIAPICHTTESLAFVKGELFKQIKNIKDKEFSAKKNTFLCDNCSFHSVCPEFVKQDTDEPKEPAEIKTEEEKPINVVPKKTDICFNTEQISAINYPAKPLRIIAGPGVGKTAVIVERAVQLMKDCDVDLKNILLVTFTNQAAEELKKRLRERLELSATAPLLVYTYNGLGYEIVKNEYSYLGFEAEPILATKMQKMDIIYSLIDTLKIEGFNYSDIETVLGDIYNFTVIAKKRGWIGKEEGEVKEDMETYFNVVEDALPIYFELLKATVKIQEAMQKKGWIDYEDQIYLTNELFNQHPEVLSRYQDKYNIINVDEFQDSDYSQCELIAKLGNRSRKITIIGDEDQGIYEWRAADIENILHFDKFFPELHTIVLDKNYRSVKEVVDVSNELIQNNQQRTRKVIYPVTTEKGVAEIKCYATFDYEMFNIANKIKDLAETHKCKYKDIAIITRTNGTKTTMQGYLESQNIPVNVVGKISLFEQENIIKIIDMIKLLSKTNNDMYAVKVLLNYGFSVEDVEKLIEERPKEIFIPDYLSFIVQSNSEGFLNVNKDKLSEFVRDYNKMKIYQSSNNIAGLFMEAIEVYGENKDTEKLTDLLNTFIGEEELTFEKVVRFIHLIKFYKDDTESDEISFEENSVKLITAHSAKGLEFPIVFIPKATEYCKDMDTIKETEAARRLFFVAVSRAKRELHISFYDNREKTKRIPTPIFLEEIQSVAKTETVA